MKLTLHAIRQRFKRWGKRGADFDQFKEVQERLKAMPTSFRKYDRRNKVYIPIKPKHATDDQMKEYDSILESATNIPTIREVKEAQKAIKGKSDDMPTVQETVGIMNIAQAVNKSYYTTGKVEQATQYIEGRYGMSKADANKIEEYLLTQYTFKNVGQTPIRDLYNLAIAAAEDLKNKSRISDDWLDSWE